MVGSVPTAKILVVDDDPDVRRVFATVLRTSYEVEEAGGGAEALARLSEVTFQLLVLDLHMPDVDGYAVLESLVRREARNHDIPVIVVTADSTDEARTRARRSRSVYFLSKPVPIRVFADIVRSTLDRSAAGRKTRPPK
jgi:CheY-like chemotaxis protein